MKNNDISYVEHLSPGSKTTLTFEKAFNKWKESVGRSFTSTIKIYEKEFDIRRPLESFGRSEAEDLFKSFAPSKRRGFLAAFKSALGLQNRIRDVSGGTYRQKVKETNVLTVQAAKIETLHEMIDPEGIDPRFYQVMVDAYRSVRTCPEDEFRVIPASKRLIRKEQERLDFMVAVDKMFEMNHLAWTIRYSQMNESFFIVRLSDLRKRNPKKEPVHEKIGSQLPSANGRTRKVGAAQS